MVFASLTAGCGGGDKKKEAANSKEIVVGASFERQVLVVTKTLGEGLWSRLYAAVRDGEQRQPVTEAFIRSARNHACDHLPFVKSAERPTYDAPTVRPGSPARL